MHLVTGAAGVIGAHLAHQLHPEGAPLLLCDFAPDAVRARHLDGLEAHPFVDAANVFTAGAPLPSLGPHGSGVRARWARGAKSSPPTRDWGPRLPVQVGAGQQHWG
ncbi:MAG: hypothetical protein ACK54B_13210, partial [Gemmatimonas sp.]